MVGPSFLEPLFFRTRVHLDSLSVRDATSTLAVFSLPLPEPHADYPFQPFLRCRHALRVLR